MGKETMIAAIMGLYSRVIGLEPILSLHKVAEETLSELSGPNPKPPALTLNLTETRIIQP